MQQQLVSDPLYTLLADDYYTVQLVCVYIPWCGSCINFVRIIFIARVLLNKIDFYCYILGTMMAATQTLLLLVTVVTVTSAGYAVVSNVL